MLKEAQCAIVVIGDETEQDVWIEDCSVAMANMHLMASSLGIGSCWVQGRLRNADEKTTEEYVRNAWAFRKIISWKPSLPLECRMQRRLPINWMSCPWKR